MKMLVAAAVAALLITSAASAQTGEPASTCAAVPEMPNLPDGSNASREAMTRANERFNEWNTAARAAIACRSAEAAAMQVQWQALVSTHNALVESVNTANVNWRTEADEFNARNADRNGRQLRQPSMNGG